MKNKTQNLTIGNLKQLPPASGRLVYFVIGPNAWGKGINAFTAFENAKKNGGKGKYTLHLVNESAEVDPVNGTLYFQKSATGLRINIGTINARGY